MDARRVLFENLIDDAGLFPPARKPLEEALADHVAAKRGERAWMLGRFLCPVSKLDELAAATVEVEDFVIGAILDGESVADDLERICAYDGPGAIRLLEAKLPAGAAPVNALRAFAEMVVQARLSHPVDEFLEVPWGDESDMRLTLRAIAHARDAGSAEGPAGAKLRCGGLEPEMFPPDAVVAAFIEEVRSLGLAFKATAGLHHPFRTKDERTGALQHGFVNLLAATALDGVPAEAVIAETDPEAFSIDAEGMRWRDHRADAEALAGARELFTAYGSCSFEEPTADLDSYGLLPAAEAVTDA